MMTSVIDLQIWTQLYEAFCFTLRVIWWMHCNANRWLISVLECATVFWSVWNSTCGTLNLMEVIPEDYTAIVHIRTSAFISMKQKTATIHLSCTRYVWTINNEIQWLCAVHVNYVIGLIKMCVFGTNHYRSQPIH